MSDTFQILVNNVLTDIADLKVAQLKVELKKRGISTAGNKQDLYEKLKKFLENEKQQDLNTSASVPNLPDNSINESEITLNLTSLETDATNKTTPPPPPQEEATETINHNEKIDTPSKETVVSEPVVEKNSTNENGVSPKKDQEELPTQVDDNKNLNTNKIESNSDASFSRDASTERSESAIKEVPMSGDRNRFSRSKSPKARWHNDDAPADSNTEHSDANTTENETNAKIETQEIETSDNKTSQATEVVEQTNETASKTEANQDVEAPKSQMRKRKWLNNDAVNVLSSKKSLTISSDTLKSYLPTPSNGDLKKDEEIKQENQVTNGRKEAEITVNEESVSTTPTEIKPPTRQFSRTVIVEEVKPSENTKETLEVVPLEVETKIEPVSNVLHINNLTRPFTLPQLKELLSKYGPLKKMEASKNEHYFWINSVKSHCYVAFEDIESAGKACEGLHNTTWPQSNPKQLQVSYSTMDEITSLINSDSTQLVPSNNSSSNFKLSINKQQILNEKENETITKSIKSEKVESVKKDISEANNEHETIQKATKGVREWDLPKYNSDSSSRFYSAKSEDTKKVSSNETNEKTLEKSKSNRSKVEEPPKTLDDLFRKTVAVPHIYWLPLTEEQFIEKQKESERRMIERLKRAEERQLKEVEASKNDENTSRYKRKLDEESADKSKEDNDEENDKSQTKQNNSSSSHKNRRKSLSSEPPRRRERSRSVSS